MVLPLLDDEDDEYVEQQCARANPEPGARTRADGLPRRRAPTLAATRPARYTASKMSALARLAERDDRMSRLVEVWCLEWGITFCAPCPAGGSDRCDGA